MAQKYRTFVRNSSYGLADAPPPPPPPPPGATPLIGVSVSSSGDYDEKQAAYSTLGAVRRTTNDAINYGDSVLTRIRAVTTNQPVVYSFKGDSSINTRARIAGEIVKMKNDSARLYYVAWHHEPEGGGEAAGADMPASQFRSQNVLMRQAWVDAGRPANVKLGTILMGYTYRTATRNPEDWYIESTPEGDKVSDFLGVDQYDPGYKSGGYSNVSSLNSEIKTFSTEKGCQFAFGEAGSLLGPNRTTDNVKRLGWVEDLLQYCNDNAGTGPGTVAFLTYWDRVTTKNWTSTDSAYATYGPIPKGDYRLDPGLGGLLYAKSPGTKAGQIAYSGAYPAGVTMYKKYVAASVAAHGIS